MADKSETDLGPNKPIVKKYEPYSVQGLYKEPGRNTICAELRKAYRNIEQGNLEDSKINIRIAITMAKAMGTKLKQYNVNAANELFPKDKKNGS